MSSKSNTLTTDIDNILLFKKYIDNILLSIEKNDYKVEDIKQLSNYYNICLKTHSNDETINSSDTSSDDESQISIKRTRIITDEYTLFDNFLKRTEIPEPCVDPFIKDFLNNNIKINNYYYLNKFNSDRINFYCVNLNLL